MGNGNDMNNVGINGILLRLAFGLEKLDEGLLLGQQRLVLFRAKHGG